MRDWRTGGGAKSEGGGDGEIKGPGPFRSMSLVVLKNFRDLHDWPSPGFQTFLNMFKGLSGTFAQRDPNV
jgi:hypothetical protein